MAVVSLTEAKLHCRVDGSTEDAAFTGIYIPSAEGAIANFLNSIIPGTDVSPVAIPAPIKHAALLLIDDAYQNRGATIPALQPIQENPAVMRLLYPYRQNIGF